ncbi:hydroxymethylbilane synthase [Chelatococcus reniformis]|uniref:Porphobilinogen deaminase n=1 Tax=Chelatococcus reniformis TaxID=1494448 RepID=A0A916TYR0_9HYPH|nr:hydroxymethylbilane synthase [Chelatococcus reniformis]GGC49957.1 porphobilinogen deaminase [Chelatococcus reniformis]
MTIPRLVVGTRGSPLALAQADLLRRHLAAALAIEPATVRLEIIKTTGDMIQDRALAQAGGKGLFTKELDAALIAGHIDLAVHSAKDLPTRLPDELVIAGYLEREDVRDVLISRGVTRLEDLPAGAVVGSASLRRSAQVRRLRPDLAIGLLRGNVETRLARVKDGKVDATLLALAGLKRLGLADLASAVLDTDIMLPAVGQGAIAVTARRGDAAVGAAVAAVAHAPTGAALAAERAFLDGLDGSCRTPIAGLATVGPADRLRLRGLLVAADGSAALEVAREGAVADAARLGEDAAAEIRARAGALSRWMTPE